MYKKVIVSLLLAVGIVVGALGINSMNHVTATTIGDNDPNAPLRIHDVYVAPGGSAQVSLSAPRGTGFNAFKSIAPDCINTTAYSNVDGCYAWVGVGGVRNSFVMAPGFDSIFFTADPNTLSPSLWGQSFTIRAASYTPEGTYTGTVYYSAGRWGPNGYVPNGDKCCVLDSLEYTIVVSKTPPPIPGTITVFTNPVINITKTTGTGGGTIIINN